MSLKWASEELLKLADDIDNEAAKVTQFVCANCNHTATLASINEKRQEAAKVADSDVIVASLNVEDKVYCPACEGTMSYKASEESKAYYFDTEKKAEDDDDDDDSTKCKKASEPIDYDSLERYTA